MFLPLRRTLPRRTLAAAADTLAVAVTSVAAAPAMSAAVVTLEAVEEATPAAMVAAAVKPIDKKLTPAGMIPAGFLLWLFNRWTANTISKLLAVLRLPYILTFSMPKHLFSFRTREGDNDGTS
jgi:hypothetical protein